MHPIRRSALLFLAMIAGGAANDYGFETASGVSVFQPNGAFGAYLTGRFAAQRTDMAMAADQLDRALTQDAGVPEVAQQAFIAATMAGRPDAARLAAALPDNPVAQLVLANRDALAGDWASAEARFATLPNTGITQVLRPLLVAWAQQGQGRTEAALATLQPYFDGNRFRGVMALHAALIADLGGQAGNATRLYDLAQAEYGGTNLRLGQMLASWRARSGAASEGLRTLQDMLGASGDLAMARPALEAAMARPVVRTPADGIAEAYLALAGALRAQVGQPASAGGGQLTADTAQVLLRLALAMRDDNAAARLVLAEAQESGRHYAAAAELLAAVPADDPLIAVVRLRQAVLLEEAGTPDEAAAALERLAAEYPVSPEPLTQLGDNYRRAKRFAAAAQAYDRALARVGTPSRANWPLFYQRGIAYERSGEWPKAEADFQYALRLSPDQPNVLNYLGYAWADQGVNLPEARGMIERAVAQRPTDGSIIDSLGWVMLKQKEPAAALTQLERAAELMPEDPVINAHLGDALDAVGRAREAEFQWLRALNLKPDPEDRERIEAKLRARGIVPLPAQ